MMQNIINRLFYQKYFDTNKKIRVFKALYNQNGYISNKELQKVCNLSKIEIGTAVQNIRKQLGKEFVKTLKNKKIYKNILGNIKTISYIKLDLDDK